MSWRWDRHGNLVPELADLMRGRAEVQRLAHDQAMALDLDQAQTTALGRAVADQHQDQANDRDLAQLIAQRKEHNRRVLAQVQRPSVTGNRIARDVDVPDDDQQQTHGHDHSRPCAGAASPDRNENFDEITWYLKNVPDPDDSEWS